MPQSFTVGATDSTDTIASFSSRGPVTIDGSNRLKPDISAPGVSIRSSHPGGSYTAHERHQHGRPARGRAGGPADLAQPDLAGNVDGIETSSNIPRCT